MLGEQAAGDSEDGAQRQRLTPVTQPDDTRQVTVGHTNPIGTAFHPMDA
ncbi:hypothetical protein ABZ801_09940 [Actinomadura sp. NPDC047616]